MFLLVPEAQEKRTALNAPLLCATVFNIGADYCDFGIKPAQN